MSEGDQAETPATQTPPTMAEELAHQPYEPLLPVEIKLISWSLALGIVLLGLLWFLVAR